MNVKKILILAALFLTVCGGYFAYADIYHYSDRIDIEGSDVLVQGSTWTDSQNASSNSLTDLSFWSIVSGATKVKVNTTGLWVTGGDGYEKVTFGSEDVIVCRSTGAVDLIIKTFTCDVVCSDSDCGTELVNSVSSNKNIIWKPGTYPVSSVEGVKMFFTGLENVHISAHGVILNATNSGHTTSFMKLSLSSEVYIDGLSILGDETCADNNCKGLESLDNTNVYFSNLNIQDIKGFQIFISCSGTCNNTHISESYFKGLGVTDVIGGGVTVDTSDFSNIFIHDNSVEQGDELGSYTGAIVIVGTDNAKIYDNTVYGSIAFGVETKATSNGKIYGNNVEPVNSTLQGSIQITHASSTKCSVNDNTINEGLIDIYGTHHSISDNKVTNTLSSGGTIKIHSYTTIKYNEVYGGVYGLETYSSSNYNKIKNNLFYNVTGSKMISLCNGESHTSIIDNEFISPVCSVFNGNVIVLINTDNIAVTNNILRNLGGSVSNFMSVGAGNTNITVKDNTFFGNYVTGEYYSVNSGALNSSYFDNKIYSGSISSLTKPCITGGVFYRRFIQNDTHLCRCDSGTWKCLGPFI